MVSSRDFQNALLSEYNSGQQILKSDRYKRRSHGILATGTFMSPRYYAAEITVWLLGATIALLRFVGIAPEQPLPLLNVQLADPRDFPRVVTFLLIAVLAYFYVEWRLATPDQRRWHSTKLAACATVAWGCFAMWFSYPLISKGTSFEGISTFWFICSIALGVCLGKLLAPMFFAFFPSNYFPSPPK